MFTIGARRARIADALFRVRRRFDAVDARKIARVEPHPAVGAVVALRKKQRQPNARPTVVASAVRTATDRLVAAVSGPPFVAEARLGRRRAVATARAVLANAGARAYIAKFSSPTVPSKRATVADTVVAIALAVAQEAAVFAVVARAAIAHGVIHSSTPLILVARHVAVLLTNEIPFAQRAHNGATVKRSASAEPAVGVLAVAVTVRCVALCPAPARIARAFEGAQVAHSVAAAVQRVTGIVIHEGHDSVDTECLAIPARAAGNQAKVPLVSFGEIAFACTVHDRSVIVALVGTADSSVPRLANASSRLICE
jgi:hypothetical protein